MIGKSVRKLGRPGVRLWGPFLLLALVLLVAGIVVLAATYVGQRRYVAGLQQEIAARASLRVSDYLQSVENSLVSGAQTFSFIGDDPAARQRYLKSLLEANLAFFELALIDPAGQETTKVVRQRRVADQNLLNQTKSNKFLTASRGENYFGPVYISEFAVPFYTLAVPVYDSAGRVIGVLAAEVNFDEMWNIVNRIPVGEAGYVYVVDGMGNLVVYHDLGLVMQQPDVAQQVAGVRRFLAGDFQVANYRGLEGRPVIGARQRIAGTDWGIITESPVREAYRTSSLFAVISILLYLAAPAVVLAMGLFITRRVVQPLAALYKGAAALGRGNLDYRIEVDAHDEIEELAAEFNAMASSLQKSQSEVEARLREISSLVEAGRAITSLDLQHVLNTLSKEAARAVEAQTCIIYVLDELSLTLKPRSVWNDSGHEYTPQPALIGQGVIGWIAKHRQPLRVEDVRVDSRFNVQEIACPHRRLLGLPLMVSDRLAGVLLVGDKAGGEGSFAPGDERLLLAFADQAAVAIENAKLYDEERRRARELELVNRISRTITASLDLETTLNAILASVGDLLPYTAAEICLWDPAENLLFTRGWGGDPAYRRLSASVYAPDEGYTGWIARHQKPLFIADIGTFEEVKPKLDPLQTLVGTYVGVPLMVGDTFVGTLELVSEELNVYQLQDVETLQTVANQAAVAIENARFYQHEQRRLREMAILYETTSALSSTLSVDELLNDLAWRMSLALQADKCAISTWDETSGILRAVAGHPLEESLAASGERQTLRGMSYFVADFPATAEVLGSQRPMTVLASDPQADPAEVALLQQYGYRSLLMLPLVMRDTVVGLVEIYDADERRFTDEEIRLAQTLTGQAAIALHNAKLFSLTDERLRKRVEELSGLQRVSQELNSTLDQDRILKLVLREAMRATGADFGNVSLYDRSSSRLLAYASFGFSDEEMARLEQLEFYVGTGVVGRALQSGEPVLVPDVSLDPDYMVISYETRSEVVVPILYAGGVAGVINLESRQLNAFSEEQLQYLEALVNQAAVAIRNALAYEEQRQQRELLRQRAEQLARLSEISHAFRSDQLLESVLEDMAYAIQETLAFKAVVINVVRGDPPMLHAVAGAGIPIVEMERLKATPQPLQVVIDLLQDRFRMGLQSYYIPHTHKEIWEDRLEVVYAPYLAEEYLPESNGSRWHPDDLCVSPLYTLEGELIGLLSVDGPQDGRIPTPQMMRTLELFADQATTAIENAQLFRSEQERRRLADTLRQVAEVVSSTLDVDQVMEAILDQLRHVVPYDSASVQVLRGDQLIITGGRGWDNPEDVLGITFPVTGDNPNTVVVRTRVPHIVPDTQATYAAFREPPHNHIRSWLGVPLLFGDDLLGMIALDSVELDHYTQEHAQLALTFANQVAVALQNAQLFERARQYADRLRVINDVSVEITSILNVDDLIARVSQLVEDNFGYRVSVVLTEEEIGGAGVTSPAAASGQTTAISQAPQAPRYVTHMDGEQSPSGATSSSEIAIPLKAQDRVIGVFTVQSDVPDAFSENDVLVLQSLTSQTAVAIANAQLFERVSRMGQELERRVQERTEALVETLEDLTLERDRVETLYRITRELSASLDLDRVLAEALTLINRAVGVSHGSIMLLDRGTGNLVYRAALGRSKGLPRGGKLTRYRRGVGLAGWVLETREPVIVPDVTEDPHWIPDEKKLFSERKSAMAVPLTAGEDALGVLLLFQPEVGYFTQDHLKLVSAAATQVATAINNAELYQLITGQAERLGVMLRTQRAEAAKHQAIVEGITDGVLVLDANRHVVLVNPAAARILDIDASAVEGQHIREILGRAKSIVDQALAQQIYDKLMADIEYFGTMEYLSGDETTGLSFRLQAEDKVVIVNLSPVLLDSGELPSLVTVLRDVSREAEVDRLKNEFISTVSHELRTPMTSIKGYSYLLVNEKVGPLSKQQRRFVQIIKRNADRLTALVNDILDISRIETGRVKLKIEALNLFEVIHKVAGDFRGQMVEKSLELVLDLPPALPPVRGDEDRVTQIMENLTSNARKYTPEGGQVTIRARVVADYAQVDVSDTGIGIDEKDLELVFDRFYRTEQPEVRAVNGSGLGLSIVKVFVELLGGKIWAESELNRGSTFSFTLPLVAKKPVVAPGGDTAAPKILVVDGDERILQLLRYQLETKGYQVVMAQYGADALQLVRSEQPAFVALDVFLGDMDAFEVLEELEKDPATANTPVIIFSIVPDAETRGLALGAAGYIGKPFEEQQVLNKMEEVLSWLGAGGNGELKRVLVADDDHHTIDWVREALTHNGFTVQGALNGHEALALAREDSPDLILLDPKMPDMDGYELIRNLRCEQATSGIPVIVITSSSLDHDYDRVKIFGVGAESMLTKQFTVETLVEEIVRIGCGPTG